MIESLNHIVEAKAKHILTEIHEENDVFNFSILNL